MRSDTEFTRWIEGASHLPSLYVDASSLGAADRVIKDLKESRKLFIQQPDWDRFLSFVNLKNAAIQLFSLHGTLSAHLAAADIRQAEQQHNRQMRSYERFMRSCARHPMLPVLRGWARRKRNALNREEKEIVVAMIDDIMAHKESPAQDPTEILAKQSYRRTQRVRSSRQRAPFIVPLDQAKLLPRDLKLKCRQFAKSVGMAGYAVPPNRTLGYEIGSYFSDPMSRWGLEDYLMGHAESDQTTSKMIKLRASQAKRSNYLTFAHQQIDGAASSSPRRVVGAMACALDRMGPAYNRLLDAANKRMQKAGFERAEEMDVYHFLREAFGQAISSPKGAFPIASTLRKAIPELVRCGGWTAGRARRISANTNGWAWTITSSSGDKAELLVFPEVKADNDSAVADQVVVRGVSSEKGPQRGLSVINMYTEQACGYFTPYDLASLCHEVGHALHGLLAPPSALIDPMVASGADMLEFPSQLLELYARDPKVLARWARADANPEFAKPSYWKKQLNSDRCVLPDHLRELLSAWSDLSVHSSTAQNLVVSEHYARGIKRFGLPANYVPDLPYMGFVWDAYAGCYFCYPLGAALAWHLGMLHSVDDLPNARDVARTFRSLQTHVLSQARDAVSMRRLMREWAGVEFGGLLTQSMDNYGKMIAKSYRSAAKAVSALPPIEG